MFRNPDNEYSEEALQKLCEKALLDLPDTVKDAETDQETRRKLALEHLFNHIQRYTGSTDDIIVIPRGLSPSQEYDLHIFRYLEHKWSLRSDKRKIIADYVERALSKNPDSPE